MFCLLLTGMFLKTDLSACHNWLNAGICLRQFDWTLPVGVERQLPIHALFVLQCEIDVSVRGACGVVRCWRWWYFMFCCHCYYCRVITETVSCSLHYNRTSRCTYNSAGVVIRTGVFGDTSTVEYLDPDEYIHHFPQCETFPLFVMLVCHVFAR